jgi:hypothetical protein
MIRSLMQESITGLDTSVKIFFPSSLDRSLSHVMKIDDLIAIYGPINCALYCDKIDQFDEF